MTNNIVNNEISSINQSISIDQDDDELYPEKLNEQTSSTPPPLPSRSSSSWSNQQKSLDAQMSDKLPNSEQQQISGSTDPMEDEITEIENDMMSSGMDGDTRTRLDCGSSDEDSVASTEQVLQPNNLMQNNESVSRDNASAAKLNQGLSAKNAVTNSAHSNLFNQKGNGTKHITVSWRNLTYSVERTQLSLMNCFTSTNGHSLVRHHKRTILNNINGHFNTGNLTAIMGPSGSGKSTLLECIIGFRKQGLTGDIRLHSQQDTKVKVALINQSDYLIECFTVLENLIYASRLKNHKKTEMLNEATLEEVVTISGDSVGNDELNSSKRNLIEPEKFTSYHQKLALDVIHQLGLDVCINTRAGSCSGGQKKRISIALEMISKPNILILDEPTSGLDSSACFQTVQVMQRLTRNERHPIAVVCTIHQPSARVFNLFDHIYIISFNGHCIYEGNPTQMLRHLTSVGLTCPQFHNPADFIAEVASGEHGETAVNDLITVKQQQDLTLTEQPGSSLLLMQYSEMMSYPTFLHIWILLQRTTLNLMRDPMLNSLRCLSHVMTAIFIGLLYGPTIGEPSLCPPLVSPLNDLEQFPAYRQKYQNETVTSTENLAFIFFTHMFIMFGSMMPTIMTFPANLSIIRKEKINGWYSVATYYIALSIAEIPFLIIYPVVFTIITYLMTSQLLQLERLSYFLLIVILIAFVAQSIGLLLGAIFMEDASAAVFLGPICTVPIMLFGGFFVRISTIPAWMRYFSYFSFLRYAFEAAVVIMYGLGRCHLDPEQLSNTNATKPEWMGFAAMVLGEGGDKFIDNFAKSLGGTYDPSSNKTYHSTILDQYNVTEDLLLINIAILVGFFLFLRLVTYFVLTSKINKKN